jgi:Tfp pilus assembly protein PilO
VNENRRYVVFGVIAVIGVIALWWVFIFSPKAHTLDDARKNRDSARSEAQTLEAQLNQLKDLQNRKTETEAQLGKLSAAIPATPNQADFISGLNDIADASGIGWQSVTMQNPAAGVAGAPETISVQIQIKGGFFQVLDYFNRLEDLDRLVVVDSVNVAASSSSKSGSGSGGTTVTTGVTTSKSGLSATLNARIFSQNPLAGAGTSTGSNSSSSSSGSSSGGSATTATTGVTS